METGIIKEVIEKILTSLNAISDEDTLDMLGDEVLGEIFDKLNEASSLIDDAVMTAGGESEDLAEGEKELTEEDIDELAAIASEFDKSGDPLLQKQASVLDQILLTIGAPKHAKEVFKAAEEQEIEKLRKKYTEEARDKAYKYPKEALDKVMKTTDMAKAVNKIKEYRPMEAPLSTRSCIDHPGAQLMHIGDSVYQCELDKKIYNWAEGFTTMKGNKVPGGSVSEQTKVMSAGDVAGSIFSDTREGRLSR